MGHDTRATTAPHCRSRRSTGVRRGTALLCPTSNPETSEASWIESSYCGAPPRDCPQRHSTHQVTSRGAGHGYSR
eukprot:4079513-Pyramimonas_sp.AAC.1